jgi:hypothetical protein
MNLCPRGAATAQGLGERSRPDPLETAEGEGFEPSRDLTAPCDFRDRIEHVDLQGICLRCASGYASARRVGARERVVLNCSASETPLRLAGAVHVATTGSLNQAEPLARACARDKKPSGWDAGRRAPECHPVRRRLGGADHPVGIASHGGKTSSLSRGLPVWALEQLPEHVRRVGMAECGGPFGAFPAGRTPGTGCRGRARGRR